MERYQGRNLRRGRLSSSGNVYLVTTITRHRRPVFHQFPNARKLIAVLREHEQFGWATTLGFVVMPDHLHWLFALGEHNTLSSVVRAAKAISSRRIGFSVWQKGFYDRAVRREEDLATVARYIVANPLRAGLVERIGDWPHWDAVWI